MSNLPAVRDPQAIQPSEPRNMLEIVMRAAQDPSIEPARLREFLEIGERLEAREAKRQFDQARAELRPKLPTIRKNGLISYGVGKGSTPFAKWDDIHRSCMPMLDEHGFSCTFSSELQGTNALRVVMTVKHTSGHEDSGSLVVPWLDTGGSKSPAQAAASSFSLAQRHVFVKYWNILTEDADDDGSGKGVPERITEEQAMRLSDMISECENREPGKFTARFKKWLKSEYQTDVLAELFQGAQYEGVFSKLKEKLVAK